MIVNCNIFGYCFLIRISIIREIEEDEDVTYIIQANWLKWRLTSRVLFDKKFPPKLKHKFYRVALRSTLLYGTKCWSIKKIHKRKMKIAEIRMLRWMCDHTRMDRIRNEVIRVRLGVAPISAKLHEGRSKWFGHVQKRS